MRLIFVLICTLIKAQHFDIIPLGVYGGMKENNLSSYLISESGKQEYLALDAGTIYSGVEKISKTPTEFIKKHIKAYAISHGHLDHLSGLIINSPEDSKKTIFALKSTIETLKTRYFTWSAWANFANEGEMPQIAKYQYQSMNLGEIYKVPNSNLKIKAFNLSHVYPQESTAFLVENNGYFFLYLGDTGDDSIEKQNNLEELWQSVSILIKEKKLMGISIECSFPNSQNDQRLFGHLKPILLINQLKNLEKINGKGSLSGINLIISHIKPVGDNEKQIKFELKTLEKEFKVKLIYPVQSKKIKF